MTVNLYCYLFVYHLFPYNKHDILYILFQGVHNEMNL